MSNIQCFTNDRFRALSYLYDIRDDENCAYITQQDVADGLGISRVTISGIFKQLKDEQYIEQNSTNVGKYTLTKKAIVAIETFRSSDN